MFDRSKSAAAQAVKKAWKVLFSAMSDQVAVYDAMLVLKAQCPTVTELVLSDVEALKSKLDQKSGEIIIAKTRLGMRIAVQAASRPTTHELPRESLLGLGPHKFSERWRGAPRLLVGAHGRRVRRSPCARSRPTWGEDRGGGGAFLAWAARPFLRRDNAGRGDMRA